MFSFNRASFRRLARAGAVLLLTLGPLAGHGRTATVPRHVFAHYYPWYGTPDKSGQWRHQDGVYVAQHVIADHVHYPALGPYDSTDPAVVARHLQEAKAAGIDTLVCSWWGRDDFTDGATRLLLSLAPTYGMHACVYWERLATPGDPQGAADELTYLAGTLGRMPGYLRVAGKPVVFLHAPACQGLRPEQWPPVLAGVDRAEAPGVLTIGMGDSEADERLWDGAHIPGPVSTMAQMTPADAARAQAAAYAPFLADLRRLGRISVETVAPGYFNKTGTPPGPAVDRQGGALYQALWRQVLQDRPDWVLVYSFNQWHDGTEIEPSVEMGDQYLPLTRRMADQFRAQGSP